MHPTLQLLAAYLAGGVTFIPLLLVIVGLHGYLTLPHGLARSSQENVETGSLEREGDDLKSLITSAEVPPGAEESARGSDVTAGYFAVCREYVPGGVNGKPPERTTPAGDIVPAETSTIYQNVYRSIFDRNKPANNEATNTHGKPPRRAKNVFFVILRHGHLMLYDDAEQIEVRYVISVAHHEVSIYGGGDEIPEGELFIRRNAIALNRRQYLGDSTLDAISSKPFFLFCDNCSEKEDFYYSLLQSQNTSERDPAPKPLWYQVPDIIKLVQRLHSSEEHMQSRWINALVGRIFLALYQSSMIHDFVRTKLSKKISRVKVPAFLSDIRITKIDMGSGAPNITNPRLKDLTVDGECSVEADLIYSGDFRIEVATTARIDLGTRFKAREVTLVLAVVLKKLQGHVLIRCKPPPSNRIWLAFESMPKMDMSIEPIVSSRQITYGVILRAIQSRIREVIAETLVLPNWDDLPFTDTAGQKVRGGIWETEGTSKADSPICFEEGQLTGSNGRLQNSNDISKGTSQSQFEPPQTLRSRDKSATQFTENLPGDVQISQSRDHSRHSKNPYDPASTSSYQPRANFDKPNPFRSGSFTLPSAPFVSMDTTSVQAQKATAKNERRDAANAMIALSGRSPQASPAESPVGSLLENSVGGPTRGSQSSTSSKEWMPSVETQNTLSLPTHDGDRIESSPGETMALRSALLAAETSSAMNLQKTGGNSLDKRQTLQALTSATTAAKKWGLGVINRSGEKKASARYAEESRTPSAPVVFGRGRPLPPPGTPLPPPEDSSRGSKALGSRTVRKTIPNAQSAINDIDEPEQRGESTVSSGPATSRRESMRTEDVLVVEAPSADSEPTTPIEGDFDGFDQSTIPQTIDPDIVTGGRDFNGSANIEKGFH
ncbi:MAG: hypothetical protein M1814_006298 [Vezdaea aestivalis]|nr:MAG: hypothetical protein M1814_006298 [Vezdaea aestivalis]